jgi:hypothetical protein
MVPSARRNGKGVTMRLLARKGVWYVRWRDASGKDRKRSLHTRDYSEAQQKALRIQLGVLNGDPLIGEETTVNWLCDWYLKRPHNLRPSTRERVEGALFHVRQGLGECSVTAPSFRGRVKTYQAERAKVVAPATVNWEVGALKRVLNEAADTFPGFVYPLPSFRQIRVPSNARRALSRDELNKVLLALKTPEEALRVGIFLYTG